MLIAGRFASGILFLLVSGIILYFAYTGDKGKVRGLRMLPQLEVMDEMIGRCTETGRSVHVTTGIGRLNSTLAAQTIAGLSILRNIAEKTARTDTGLIVTVSPADNLPMIDDVVKTAYKTENAADRLAPDAIRYLARTETLGINAIYAKDNCGASIFCGAFTSGAIINLETASVNDIMTIFGNARMGSYNCFPFADYALIGEELYSAGAYLSKDPAQTSTIVGQDSGKLIAIALIVLGILLHLVNVDIGYFLKM